MALGLQNIDFQPLFGSAKGSRVLNPNRLGISSCVATPPASCTGSIVVILLPDDVLRLEIEQGLVAVDNRTGSNTFSGYLIHTAEDKVSRRRECREEGYYPTDNNINSNPRPPIYITQQEGSRPNPGYLPPPQPSRPDYLPQPGLIPPPPGENLKPPGSTSGGQGNGPVIVGPPAPPPEVRFTGDRPGLNYPRPPYNNNNNNNHNNENNIISRDPIRPPYYPTQRPSYYSSTSRPDYNPSPTDSYGAPPLDGYGAPQAPPIDSYGAPVAAPISSYEDRDSSDNSDSGNSKSEVNQVEQCCDVLRVRLSYFADNMSGIFARSGVWRGRPLYKHVSNNLYLYWFEQTSWLGWVIGETIGSFDGSSLSSRQRKGEEEQCPHKTQNGWQYFDKDKQVFVLDRDMKVECLEEVRNSRNIHFHTHLHSYPDSKSLKDLNSVPYYTIRADSEIVEAKFVYPNPKDDNSLIAARNTTK